MKFYTSHQISLHSAILDAGFIKADFSFLKKKGRIIAQYNHGDASFSFIERRESTLDTTLMRLTDRFTYEFNVNAGNIEIAPSWDVLLERFQSWLISVKSNN